MQAKLQTTSEGSMEHVERLKPYFVALSISFFAPVPLKVAISLIVVVFASGLLGAIAIWRRRGRVSAQRVLALLLRGLVYLVLLPALYYVTHLVQAGFLWDSVVYLLATYELGILLQELYDSGLLPRWLVEKIDEILATLYRHDERSR